MSQTTQILIADFSKPEITYRIAASRTHQYGELIAIARRICERPTDEFKAHVHFHASACDGRAVKSEWDEGWYFGAEFCKGRELMVYVHFERWSLAEKIERAKSRLGLGEDIQMTADEKELVRLREVGDEQARAGRWWEAVWWWKMARKLEMRMETDKGRDGNAAKGSVPDGTVKDAQKTEGKTPQLATKKGLPDFVRNEILEVVRDEFSGAVHINLSERLKSEIAETVKESLLGVLDHKMTEIVKNETRKIISEEGLGGYAPRRKRRRVAEEEDVYESISEERLDTSKFPWPVSYPSQIPTTPMAIQDVITVDAYATKNHYSDLIVGRARLTFCLDPKIRPLVRAKLVPQTFETLRRYNVCMFIPSKYSKVPDRTGELQIPHDQVEFLPAFDGTTRQERSSKMAAALNKYGPQSSEFTIVDTYTGSGFLDWDIIIGHARPEVCADPAARPLVRASLTTDDKVVAYMPARYGSDRNRIDGELGVAIKDVKVWKEFDAPVESKRREMIKEALVRNRNDRLGKVCPGASTERGTEEVRQGGGTEEVDG